jgi:2-iminobutanoate/2-iminopropanoate deaminase
MILTDERYDHSAHAVNRVLTAPAVVLACALSSVAAPSGAEVVIERSNPKGLSQPKGYSQLVTVRGAGKMVLLGGKAGILPDGSFPKSLAEQSKQMFENTRIALEAAGASPKDVIEIEVFIVDLAKVDPNPVYQDITNFFPAGHKPVSMVIGVSALAYPGLLVEINVRAIVPER